MDKIVPCLWFEANALEAAKFYTRVFPGSTIDKVHQAPTDTPGGKAGDVLLIEMTLAGRQYQLLAGGPHHKFNDAVSLSVTCADQAEVDRYWDMLTGDGGAAVQCGWLRDKYGLSWQIVPRRLIELMGDPDPARGRRVMQAMLQMVKLDVAALEAAAKGD